MTDAYVSASSCGPLQGPFEKTVVSVGKHGGRLGLRSYAFADDYTSWASAYKMVNC